MIKEIILNVTPKWLLAILFPHRFGNKLPMFIQTFDSIANKGLKLYLREDSFMERVIRQTGLYGDWEKESLKIWATLSKQANTIIDIGANTGIFSLIAKNNNANATVIAIEPINTNFDVLSKNIKKNKLDIIAEKVALSDKKGIATMFMLKDLLNYMTSVNDNRYDLHPEIRNNHPVVEVKVPTDTFESIFNKHRLSKLDLIKIDVEGHEIAVLNNMLPLIEKYKPAILIEIIGDDNAAQIQQIVAPFNYSFVSIDEVNLSYEVDKLWDNDHHNFLLCNKTIIKTLKDAGLVSK